MEYNGEGVYDLQSRIYLYSSNSSYTDLEEGDHSHVYAELAVKVLDKVVEGGAPYLPAGIGLVCLGIHPFPGFRH